MGLLADWQIKAFALDAHMIDPFVDHKVRQDVISYGLSSYGYDIRIADEFQIFTPNAHGSIVDVKAFDNRLISYYRGERCIIPPNSFALARSYEYMRIPVDTMCIVLGKSTYARAGIVLNCTPLEPNWEGFITLEVSNTTPLPAAIYANEGIGQVLFFRGEAACEHPYPKDGKYQGQQTIVAPKVER
jgi:dCTP deaminase